VLQLQAEDDQRVDMAANASCPSPAAAPSADQAKIAAAVVTPFTTWLSPMLCRNTKPPPINPMPVTAPANAFGAALCDSTPITAAPTPIKEKVRSPADPGTDPARLGSLHLAHEYQEERPSS